MERRKIGIAQASHLFQSFERQAGVTLDRHSDFLGRLEFRRKLFGRVFADRGKEIAVDTAEVAFDPLLLRNGFDAIDRGGVTFIKSLGAIETAHLRDAF